MWPLHIYPFQVISLMISDQREFSQLDWIGHDFSTLPDLNVLKYSTWVHLHVFYRYMYWDNNRTRLATTSTNLHPKCYDICTRESLPVDAGMVQSELVTSRTLSDWRIVGIITWNDISSTSRKLSVESGHRNELNRAERGQLKEVTLKLMS